jgi:hypothetical protein
VTTDFGGYATAKSLAAPLPLRTREVLPQRGHGPRPLTRQRLARGPRTRPWPPSRDPRKGRFAGEKAWVRDSRPLGSGMDPSASSAGTSTATTGPWPSPTTTTGASRGRGAGQRGPRWRSWSLSADPRNWLICREKVRGVRGPRPLGSAMDSSACAARTSTATTGAWPSPASCAVAASGVHDGDHGPSRGPLERRD